MIIWVIGAGGLFGSAVVRSALGRGDTVIASQGVPWGDPDATENHLHADFLRLEKAVARVVRSSPWGIVWAAGKVTTASSASECQSELEAFERYLTALRTWTASLPPGRFFLTSSAGGVYAGSHHPPFSSQTAPSPLGTYGLLKLDQESLCRRLIADRLSLVIGRSANLYGPGQDTRKLQGLVSRLCLASITRETVEIFVSLDTLRDFIYVDDAAALALHWLDVASVEPRVRLIASGEPTTLGHVVATTRDVVRSQIPITFGLHASAAAQSADMRLIPDRDEFSDALPRTHLAVGIRSVYLDLLGAHQLFGQPVRAASFG